MENEKHIITDELIGKYLAGEAGPEEAIALHDWLTVPANRQYFEKLQLFWRATHPGRTGRVVSAVHAWSNISHQIDPRAANLSMMPSRVYNRYAWTLKIAASLLLLVAVGIGIYVSLQGNITKSFVTLSAADTVTEAVLSDHSRVILSRNATLSYPRNFAADKREVSLTGEAFFNVSANAEKPFWVHTGVADIKVVGTSFNVIQKSGHLEVSVAEGTVMVATEAYSKYLPAGHTAIIQHGDSIYIRPTVDPNSWGYATHRFVFKDTPLRNVFQCIEKSYHYPVKVSAKTIENCKLTATFENASAEDMLSLIAETLDLKVTKHGKAFFLEGKGCH